MLAKYEARFGKRGTSDVTVDKMALDQLMGPARVIDVRDLVEGTTAVEPGKSPAITLERVQAGRKERRPDRGRRRGDLSHRLQRPVFQEDSRQAIE